MGHYHHSGALVTLCSAAYSGAALALRDRLIIAWNKTQQQHTFVDSKRVYCELHPLANIKSRSILIKLLDLSLEFLMGRTLDNAMLNVGIKQTARDGLDELGFRIEDVIDQEHDAALGNGGLGRLAACFLDSLATLNYPGWGYGLRYRYGMLRKTVGL